VIPDGVSELVDRVERAIACEFGVHPGAVTGRATERRCILASAVLASLLSRAGATARVVGGQMSVYRPGVTPLDVELHALVLVGDRVLLDATIAQAHRPRFGSALDVDYALLPVPGELQDGHAVWLSNGDLSLRFTYSEALTRHALSTPDGDPARVAQIIACMGENPVGIPGGLVLDSSSATRGG
jgi:hypothetical protein